MSRQEDQDRFAAVALFRQQEIDRANDRTNYEAVMMALIDSDPHRYMAFGVAGEVE